VTTIDIGPCPYPGWTGNFYRVHLGPIMPNAALTGSEEKGISLAEEIERQKVSQ